MANDWFRNDGTVRNYAYRESGSRLDHTFLAQSDCEAFMLASTIIYQAAAAPAGRATSGVLSEVFEQPPYRMKIALIRMEADGSITRRRPADEA